MSFTTRCPACGTVFRVVADQLKISDGWVRCGHCSDVFDATVHLSPWVPSTPANTPPSAPSPTPPPAPAPGPSTASFAATVTRPESVTNPLTNPVAATPPKPVPGPAPVSPSAPVAPAPAASLGSPDLAREAPPPVEVVELPDDDDLRAWFGDGPLEPPPGPAQAPVPGTLLVRPSADRVDEPLADGGPAETVPPPDTGTQAPAGSLPAPDPAFHAELERFAQTVRTASTDASVSGADGDASTRESPPVSNATDAAPVDDDDAGQEPGFVRQARRRAFWQSPGVRAGLGLLALLLGALLAVQWALQDRHRLVVAHPDLRPWFEQACGLIGCDLAPLRRIDAVEIESAELVRRLGNFYSFDFVLRNRAGLDVALPALELTLTNSSEEVIARRVFLPQEWPGAPASLAANGRVQVSLRLSLTLSDDVPTAGYRALVFYP